MLKKYLEQIRKEFTEALSKNAEFLKSIKADESNGTFKVIVTKQVVDRDQEMLLVDGAETENYLKNPIVLFAHDYWSLPIGKATNLIKESDQIIAEGVFASAEMNPVAQNVRRLYDAGILKTVSVGFIPKQWEGNLCSKWEMLEFSFVPVPANPEALSLIAERGLEKDIKAVVELAVKKGLSIPNEYQKFVKDIKTTDPVEPKKVSKIAKLTKNIKELISTFKDSLSSYEEKMNEINTNLKSLGEKIVEIQSQVVKDDKGQSNEVKSDLESILKDTHQKAQLIAKISNQVNENLKKLK